MDGEPDANARIYRSMTPSPEPMQRSWSPGPAGRMPEMEGFPEIRPYSQYVERSSGIQGNQVPSRQQSYQSRTAWSPGSAGRIPEMERYPEIQPASHYSGLDQPNRWHLTDEVREESAAREELGESTRLAGQRMGGSRSHGIIGEELDDSIIITPRGDRIEVDEFATFLSGSPRLRRRTLTLTVTSDASTRGQTGIEGDRKRNEDAPPPYTC